MQDAILDDVVVAGVVNTVAARRDLDESVVIAWADEIGSERFYSLLNDSTGDVEAFFVALANGEDVDDFPYDKTIGPAVDRIEDAFADSVTEQS